ncbi:hypothetical protein JTE90_011753 [Oedothorax gibbosus]|uniref:RRM domain-containing protein n=1 Tax=Oedothorax gibbosus TaxID=931172 RepID=A0AAV6VUB4_9ARAC|nr:hypothetical protein JTE90_011753 [Oedothorax gibbosus]
MSTRIYIGRLNYEVRERDLEKFFKGYGRIREILIKNGFGFVEFDDYRDAEDAVYDLNGKELLGDRVTIEHARGSPRGNDMYRDRNRGYRAPMQSRRRQGGGRDKYGPPTRTEYRLIVENLSSRVSWQFPSIQPEIRLWVESAMCARGSEAVGCRALAILPHRHNLLWAQHTSQCDAGSRL